MLTKKQINAIIKEMQKSGMIKVKYFNGYIYAETTTGNRYKYKIKVNAWQLVLVSCK